MNVEKMEISIAKFLRGGVVIAGLLMLAGWLMQIRWHGNIFFTFELYDQIPLTELLRLHIHRGHWAPLVSYAGLATLIALPLLRVLLTAILFLRNKELKLAVISLMVLGCLLLSMLLGIDL